MNDEKYYPALRKLVAYPEWRVFEEFMDEEIAETLERLVNSPEKDLNYNRGCVIRLREFRARVKKLLQEVEEIKRRDHK